MEKKGKNRLQYELSPYLQHHADNPVDWFPWGDEAFEEAKKRDVPIFLSIGYSTCHWCHVMEQDSFNNKDAADLLNRAFVAVKVDREERPDIDSIYMDVCHVMTGQGGWPLTIIMTPDKKPFYAGTFIPRESRYGMVGILDLIPQISDHWLKKRGDLENLSDDIIQHLQKIDGGEEKISFNPDTVITRAVSELKSTFDTVNGGFGNHPKFPTPHNLLFLLYHDMVNRSSSGPIVEKSLMGMRLGGIYDHIGFGFHRYSTDAKWRVPHFEKMLYDQAMLILAYGEGGRFFNNRLFVDTVDETVQFLKNELLDKEGGFYSAIDADSEGREGKFYIWDYPELQMTGAKEFAFITEHFDVTAEGNFTDPHDGSLNSNVLYLKHPILDKEEEWEIIRNNLNKKREERIKPFKDTKILTDWNGLVIGALARTGRLLGKKEYTEMAQKAASFILDTMIDDNGTLLHLYKDGTSKVKGFLTDYSFMIFGLIELYQATFDLTYIEKAIDLQKILDEEFLDKKGGGYFQSGHGSENLLIRKKEIYDGPYPSGNSIAMNNLIRLYRITGNEVYSENSISMAAAFGRSISSSPSAYTQWVINIMMENKSYHEIIVAGEPNNKETQKVLETIYNLNLPNTIVILKTEKNSSQLAKISPFTENQTTEKGVTTVYVCSNFSCHKPVVSAEEVALLLG